MLKPKMIENLGTSGAEVCRGIGKRIE